MKLILKRTWLNDKCSIGKLYIGAEFECYTLEDAVREVDGQPVKDWKIPKVTAIPRGTYNIVLHKSPRFKKTLPMLESVPGFEYILIHQGNWAKNTEGCILVGATKVSDEMIGGSEGAFKKLMPKIEASLKNKEKVTIEVS